MFGIPLEGMDQKTFLVTAYNMSTGKLPQNPNMLSPLYTLWVTIIFVFAGGNVIIMRILQAVLCAFIPVMIYKLAIRLRLGVKMAQVAAMLHCFYGAAILISIDFLRAAPLSLCFIIMTYFLYKGFLLRSALRYFLAGLFAAFCILGRENFIPIVFAPMLLLLFPFIRNRCKFKHGAVYVAAIILTLAPFLIYNFIRFNSLELIPGNGKNIASFYHGDSSGDISSLLTSCLKNIPAQSYKFISSYEIPNGMTFYAYRDVIDILNICIVPFNLLVIMALVGIILNYRNRAVLIVGLAAFSFFSTMIYFEMFYRFRIPVEPLLCVLAAAGLKGFFELKGIVPKLTLAGIVCVLLFVTYQEPMRLRPEPEKRTVVVIFIRQGLLSRAEEMVSHLDQSAPETAILRNIISSEYSKIKH